jgi:hypothetical protein
MGTFNMSQTFTPGNTFGPWSGYASQVNDESILRNHAFAFSEDIDTLKIHSVNLTYSSIQVNVDCNKAGSIILQQNNYYSRKKVEAKHIHPDQISFYNSFFFRDFTAKSAARAVRAM